MKRLAPLLAIILVGALLSSCVSKKKYDEAMAAAAAEKAALEKQLDEANAERERLQGEMAKLENNLSMSKEEIQKLSEEIKTNNGKIEKLRNAIADVFSTYDANQVNVTERDGKLYITMANSILFDAGRAKLDANGKDVIAKLAQVFKDNADLNVAVEGHTDNDPVQIHKAKYQDNWSLGVDRASNVVRELVANGVAENRLVASGKGEFQPIADNATDEGKEKNRRTEFVIMPKISGLYKMYKSEMGGSGTN